MLYSKIFADENRTICYYIMRMYEDRDGADNIIVRVEVEEDPDAFAEFRLPGEHCYKAFGFSEEELLKMERYLLRNAVLIWDDAREGLAHAKTT